MKFGHLEVEQPHLGDLGSPWLLTTYPSPGMILQVGVIVELYSKLRSLGGPRSRFNPRHPGPPNLRFGMTGPLKYAIQTPSPEEVYIWMSRVIKKTSRSIRLEPRILSDPEKIHNLPTLAYEI